MHKFETRIQELKISVLTEISRLCWDDKLNHSNQLLEIPEKIIPGDTASLRCCVHKERAIVQSRMKLALGGEKTNPSIVEVMSVACDECPVTEISVSPACRGCLAQRCLNSCPKDAIIIQGHRATIDHDKCISCGRCVTACQYGAISKTQRPCERSCPAKAITMNENKKAQIDPNACISCGTCVIQCPFGAIQDKSWITDAISMLRGSQTWGYRTYAVIAPSIAGQFTGASYKQLVAGLHELGFHGVFEVALGADMVADKESDELMEKAVLSSSCCPGFVGYVKKKHPQITDLVSHTPSPMVMIGLHIKEKFNDAKVIFIGPCIAKKKEVLLGRAMQSIDCALTYEELYALFQSKDIELNKLDEVELDEASSFGRNFARSGGVAQAVAQILKEKNADFALKALPCSGIPECEKALVKYKAGKLEENFIEGMACEGGCVQGAGCLIRSPKNKMEVEKHAKEAKDRSITSAVTTAQEVEGDKPKYKVSKPKATEATATESK